MNSKENSAQRSLVAALVVCCITIVIAVGALIYRPTVNTKNGNQQETSLQRIRRTGVMKVGYSGFPPYTIIDTQESDSSKRIKGFSADLVDEIAARSTPAMKVEWHLINWETLRSDMVSHKIDFIADPVYQTVPRALEFSFCDPYSYFGVALAVVRRNDDRFKTFGDLDRKGITIAISEGWVSSEYARAHLTRPTLKIIPVGGDAFVQLDDVLMGRADVALQDSPTVVQYVKAHSKKVQVLWLEHPPSIVPGSFAVRTEDSDLLHFLNSCLTIMRADGTIDRLDQKWKTYGYFENRKLVPAQGLAEFLSSEQTK